MKVYVESKGCESNLADTNRIISCLKLNGINLVGEYKNSDFIILMSCGFNKIMMNENLKRLREFSKTNAKIVLGGCIPKINPEIKKLVDYSFGPKELNKLNNLFKLKIKINKLSPQFIRKNKKIIRIATGCLGKCSYCAIKLANGTIKSRNIKEIKKDIRIGLKEGYSKFIFTAEDTGAWGEDLGKNIVELLKEVTRIKGEFRVTLTTINPKWFIKYPQLIEKLKSEKIEKRVYFPLQTGSNRILKLMNREYTSEQYLEIFHKLESEIPEIKIQSDALVGFPTETEKDFQKTLKLIKKLNIYFLQVFLYTDMKRTKSYNLKPKVPKNVAKERAKKIILSFLNKNKGIKRNMINTNIKGIHELLKK